MEFESYPYWAQELFFWIGLVISVALLGGGLVVLITEILDYFESYQEFKKWRKKQKK